MSLLTDYQGRYSLQARTNFSNPQSSSPTTPDTTRETYAASDAEGDFRTICGVAYDGTNIIHVSAAVPLVAAKLLAYTLQQDSSWYDQQLERLEKWYRLVLGRNRVLPTTNSRLVPSTETFGSAPAFDIKVFENFIGNAPGHVSTATDNPSRSTTD